MSSDDGLESVDDDLLPDGYDTEASFPEIVVGAWREALAEDGIARVNLVLLLILITVVPPVLALLMLLGALGVI